MNRPNLTRNFAPNNEIIHAMSKIFIVEITLTAKYYQFKENFEYGCFPKN